MKDNWLTTILLIIIAMLLFLNILTGLTDRCIVIKLSDTSLCELDGFTGEAVIIHTGPFQYPKIHGLIKAFEAYLVLFKY